MGTNLNHFTHRSEKIQSRAGWMSIARGMAAVLLISQQVGFAQDIASVKEGIAVSGGMAHLSKINYDNGRLMLHIDKDVAYKVFSLSHPERLVVELPQTVHASKPYEAKVDDSMIRRIRSAQFQMTPTKITRVVLDLKGPLSYKATREKEDLVILLTEKQGKETASVPSATAVPERSQAVQARTPGKISKVADAHETPDLFIDDSADAGISGEAEASLLSGASKAVASSTPRKKGRDILATLPRTPVTIDFDNADIRDVMRVLSEMSGVNLIHGPDLRQLVTIHLDQVPFDEAFTTILSMNGLVAQQMGGNVLRILTPEDLSSDRSRSVTTYKTYYLNYAKASDVTQHLGAVRISPNAKVTVDERTNALVVTDTPEGLSAAERLIFELDKKPKQVMIEAKMVEVRLDDTLSMGIQWEYAGTNSSNGETQIVGIRETKPGTEIASGVGFLGVRNSVSNPGELEEVTIQPLGPGRRGSGVALPGSNSQNAAITFGLINNSSLLTATLDALQTKGLTKVLSSPKVITINNQQAKIQVGQRIPYSISNVAASGVATQSVQFIDAGIILTVTPTINADNRVRVNVRPEVSIPGANTPIGPPINTRTAQTEVLIRDGETLVIGGLIDENIAEAVRKVPLLGDIPVLGAFFRNRNDTKTRNELLVFITPTIIND